ncbi:chain-length determining protein [Emticicia aquatilis]|uniref:Chain-length determining protein n=1 Tax=Emticicia aquatilis TaxID=1537369 RepID=A0A916YWQ9_9BACT|nr:Wzz/FepE/Etk N-terminal domain-containing protein [Emticicia aquatilis]GGD64638.1 chain-length determining protein [Emticicia aquatilis]
MEEEKDIVSIDFNALFKIIWKEKIWIILITLLFAFAGIYYALTAREEFISTGKILPEYQSKAGGLGQFAGLASLAGIDVSSAGGGGSDAIRPDLYPDVLKSTPFFLDLLKIKVKTKDNKEMTFSQFYDTFVLDNKIEEKNTKIKFPTSNQYIAVSYQTEKDLKDLRERIGAVIDKKTGLITVTVKLPDPVVATIITDYSMNFLTNYITNYRTEKAKRDLNFLAERLDAAKGKYYTNQAKKAQYSDQYQLSMMKLQAADLQRERIESEYKISSTFYNTLLQKYEEAKLKLQQETPVLKVLEPPVVPNKRSEPKRTIVVLIATFLGGIFGIIFGILRKKNYKLIIK